MDLPCQVGQRGVGAADPCTLHRGDALPFSIVTWGLRRPVAAVPAASLLFLCHCCFSLTLDCQHPWGCAGTSWDGGMGREGGNFHGNR